MAVTSRRVTDGGVTKGRLWGTADEMMWAHQETGGGTICWTRNGMTIKGEVVSVTEIGKRTVGEVVAALKAAAGLV